MDEVLTPNEKFLEIIKFIFLPFSGIFSMST